MKTPLEPAIEGVEVTPVRPRRRHTAPAVELLLENLAAHLFQTRAGIFLVLTFRKQVHRRLSPEIFQISTRYSLASAAMQPIQEWLARSDHDRCSVDGDHLVSTGQPFPSGSLPIIVVQHPTQPLAALDRSTIASMGFVRR